MRVHPLLVLGLLIAPPAKAQDLSPREIAAQARAAVVLVTALQGDREIGQGSGFVVSPDGRIVTNRHVVEGASALQVRMADGEVYDHVFFVSEDARRDIVVLRIPATGLATIELADDRSAAVGDAIYVMGNPLGLEGTFSNGLISARRMEDGTAYIQISAPISPGSSGGPVLNAAGKAIGVATLILNEGQNLNMAVPTRYAAGLLAMNETPKPWSEVSERFATAGAQGSDANAQAANEELEDWERVLLDEMKIVEQTAKEHGLIKTHEPAVEMLKQNETYSIDVEFDRVGAEVMLVAVCDVDCTDIDIAAYDGSNKLIERDVSVGDRAVVAFTVARAGRFRVVASMAACSVQPCGFAVMAFSTR